MPMQKLDLTSLVRFLEILPKSGDKELGLLKAHLAIEEVLTKIICKNSKNEKYIFEAKLQFHQKINIVRAIVDISDAEWLWKALELINKARNHLSHSLTIEELDSKIESFTYHVKSQNTALFNCKESETFSDFHMAAFATYICLAVHADFETTNLNTKTILTAYDQ